MHRLPERYGKSDEQRGILSFNLSPPGEQNSLLLIVDGYADERTDRIGLIHNLGSLDVGTFPLALTNDEGKQASRRE